MEGERDLSGLSIIRALILYIRAPPSWPNHLWKAFPTNTIGLDINIWILGWHEHPFYRNRVLFSVINWCDLTHPLTYTLSILTFIMIHKSQDLIGNFIPGYLHFNSTRLYCFLICATGTLLGINRNCKDEEDNNPFSYRFTGKIGRVKWLDFPCFFYYPGGQQERNISVLTRW